MTAAWHVYILRCGDGSLYTGIARDVEARLAQHEAGRGARYTRGRGPLALVHVEAAADKGEALRREAAIRRLGRAGKEALAAGKGGLTDHGVEGSGLPAAGSGAVAMAETASVAHATDTMPTQRRYFPVPSTSTDAPRRGTAARSGRSRHTRPL
ncbi:GIY-YIG nuclease family protein [Sorangium sp. So ce861]|uniref:GIY-YIG nuclease family protein n=1 Tax=Sorangium sp. So ce861 TaxID=3133323 RepID=UPI003F61F2E4